jgi:hypothetical protein
MADATFFRQILKTCFQIEFTSGDPSRTSPQRGEGEIFEFTFFSRLKASVFIPPPSPGYGAAGGG